MNFKSSYLQLFKQTLFTSIVFFEENIIDSLKKTNRLLIIDEDIPGGASSYILQKIIEEQKGYNFLDSEPQTLSAKEHRPPYGKDGNYFTKPSSDDIFEKGYGIMNEVNPSEFPSLY